jgi:carbon starvation protein
MSLLPIVLGSAVILTIAYFTYGRLLARLFQLDPNRPTPAYELRDDLDYIPTEPGFLLSQHFSAIAAAGPIVGPIVAGVAFGWLPALIWILVGSIFIGGVHDMAALVASIRHKAHSIAEVVREHMSQRSYLLFLTFIWIALVYIIVAFTDITAQAFLGSDDPAKAATAVGPGVASSSLMYLVLPIIMGLLLRFTRLSIGWATAIFLPLMALAIYLGQLPAFRFDLAAILGIQNAEAHKIWDLALLGYCLIAAVTPVWLLLQPRGHLGGYFLYVALGAFALGMVLAYDTPIEYPAFLGWNFEDKNAGMTKPLAPFVFVLIACGACSGFHALIASGSTSKQLRNEADAKPIGYGTMLLEAMVAICSLVCVMMLAPTSEFVGKAPNEVYANGVRTLLARLPISAPLLTAFALMAFTTFVYDTLDVCTRLGRYIIQELTGWHDARGRWLGTALTAGVPAIFVMSRMQDASGNAIPVWKVYWELFGASNQLLAALTLLGITVWLWRTRRAAWVWPVVGLPAAFMYAMSTWALLLIVRNNFGVGKEGWKVTTTWVGLILVALAGLMLAEAIRVLLTLGRRGPTQPAMAVKATA